MTGGAETSGAAREVVEEVAEGGVEIMAEGDRPIGGEEVAGRRAVRWRGSLADER